MRFSDVGYLLMTTHCMYRKRFIRYVFIPLFVLCPVGARVNFRQRKAKNEKRKAKNQKRKAKNQKRKAKNKKDLDFDQMNVCLLHELFD